MVTIQEFMCFSVVTPAIWSKILFKKYILENYIYFFSFQATTVVGTE